MFVFCAAVLQDYVYSRLQGTGFYISESLLYNTFWIFFIPFTVSGIQLLKLIKTQNVFYKILYNIGMGVAHSLVHILLFTALFVGVSHIIYTPPHRFSNILNAALSNQLYIALLWYTIFPFIFMANYKSIKSERKYTAQIKLKVGSKTVTIPTASIQSITTDKPYSAIHVDDTKYLDTRSLKELESALHPNHFVRVHRSSIVHTRYIRELQSRSNGDYDALLQNGQMIRFSRHYRDHWKQLLH